MSDLTPGVPDEAPPQTTGEVPKYREVTISSIVFGVLVGIVMNAAITYAGLKIGFTIGGSAIAAVLGFGVLRGILRRGTVLETNIAQTVASAVNTSNSGVIFTVPVLLLIGYQLDWMTLDFWLITLACVAGAMLGTAFIIPLRKQMIDIERLRFPSATGVATILKSPGAGVKKTIVLVCGIALGAAIYLPAGLPSIRKPVPLDSITHAHQRTMSELVAYAQASLNPKDGASDEAFDRLDELVYNERLDEETAQATRDAAGWIRAEKAPPELIARGALIAKIRTDRAALAQKVNALSDCPIEPGTKEEIATLKSDIAKLETQLETEPGGQYPDEMLLALHTINAEGEPWGILAERNSGWATQPLMGYADLGRRLPRVYDEAGELDKRVDRDSNGRADLVVTDDGVDVGRMLWLPGQFQLIFAIAPFALGAGFITGKPGLMVLAGGILAFFVINPFVYSAGYLPAGIEAHDAPGLAFGLFDRPLGIGLLLGGALMGVIAAFPAIIAALRSLGSAKLGGRDEMGIMPLLLAIVSAIALLFFAADYVGNKPINEGGLDPVNGLEVTCEVEPAELDGYLIRFADADSRETWETDWTPEQKQVFMDEHSAKRGWLANLDGHWRALIIAIVGCAWIWFTGLIIAQCTGMTDWSPISGMALLTVVLVLMMAGTGAVIGAVLIGAALCVAITLAADMMGDLKTGYLVGAQPRRQQMVEMCVVWIGPVIAMFTVVLIAQVNLRQTGIAMGPGTPTSAPQAQALQAVIEGVQGGMMPYALYGIGSLLGVLLGLGSFAGLGVLVGLSMYLPFQYIATYGIGCVVNIVLGAFKGRRFCEEWGVPFAAGLIVGESILALLINIYVLATG
jgi:OPT oligopeptide transporter protein